MNYIFNGFTKAIHLLLTGNASVYSAIFTTLKSSTCSTALSLIIGIPIGFKLGYSKFFGQKILKTLANTLLALPTVVIGLFVYVFFSHSGPFGNLNILFTLKAMIIGQTILALPIVIALTSQAIETIDKRLKNTILTLGANRKKLILSILYESRYAIFAAGVMAYGRVVSEVGIAMMVGGNIKWFTRTITTAIAFETGKGAFATGIALGLVLLLFAFIINALVMILRNRYSPS